MRALFLLLSPRILGIKHTLKDAEQGSRKKGLIMGTVCLLFLSLMFVMSARVLRHFRAQEMIGDIIAHHLLSMVLLTLFSLLIFSNIIAALSNLYLSKDLELCHASPASLDSVFLSRCVHTLVDSSWMAFVFGLPVMISYAYVFRPGAGFYLNLLHMSMALSIIAAGLGIMVTMILVSIFPARRTRDIVMLLSIMLIVALYFLFRFLRPERLVNPDAFFSVMQYISALKSPDSPYLPTHWVSEILWAHLSGTPPGEEPFYILLIWSTAAALVVMNLWVADGLYFNGYSKSQEAKRRRGTRKILDMMVKFIRGPLGPDMSSIVEKDVRTFFRDNSQWSQLLLLGALVVVYLFNIRVLPLERSPVRLEFLQNEIAFLNMGLAGFVLSAISVRFVFPAISSEGEAFWIMRSSPISSERLLWSKYVLYLVPMLLIGMTLTVVTNVMLDVSPFMMALSTITMFLAVFGIVALAIGLGALYPRFRHENIAQVATGFGGLVYMICAALFMTLVIVLEAGPVYIFFMSNIRNVPLTALQWVIVVGSFAGVLIVNLIAFREPMKMGLRALEKFE